MRGSQKEEWGALKGAKGGGKGVEKEGGRDVVKKKGRKKKGQALESMPVISTKAKAKSKRKPLVSFDVSEHLTRKVRRSSSAGADKGEGEERGRQNRGPILTAKSWHHGMKEEEKVEEEAGFLLPGQVNGRSSSLVHEPLYAIAEIESEKSYPSPVVSSVKGEGRRREVGVVPGEVEEKKETACCACRVM